MSKERLAELHAADKARGLTEDQLQQLYVYFTDCERSWEGLAPRPLMGTACTLCPLRRASAAPAATAPWV